MTHPQKQSLSSPLGLVLLATVLYGTGFLLWYGSTPLGMQPVLDGKENLLMAEALANREFDGEPFFRAPLYPALLSLALTAGLPEAWLPHLARIINGILHFVSTLLIYKVGLRISGRSWAAAAAAALYGLNPVALHFAGDPLDATLSVTLLLAGLLCLLPTQHTPDGQARGGHVVTAYAGLAGLLLGLAVVARPNLLSAALLLPCFPLLQGFWVTGFAYSARVVRMQLPRTVAAGAGLLVPLLSVGLINHTISGHFVVLPTQGAYNLWSANKSGAHGKYHVQVLDIQVGPEGHRNPARVESERLYEIDVGEPPEDVFQLQAYWRQRALNEIAADPFAWLGRISRKAYYLTNHYEQYNNKTYAWHKERSPWLRYNPIGWALLFAAGLLGLALSWRQPASRIILLAGLTYAAGLLLFYVSARFRLPLAALLAAGSSGLWAALPGFLGWSKRKQITLSLLFIALLGISLVRFGGVADRSTRVMDHMLMAQAAFELGNDQLATRHAEAALTYRPELTPARELLILARFNHAAAVQPEWLRDPTFLRENLALADSIRSYSPQIDYTRAVYLWHLGDTDNAAALWARLVPLNTAAGRDALAALLWTGSASQNHIDLTRRLLQQRFDPILATALVGPSGDAGDNPYHRHLSRVLGD